MLRILSYLFHCGQFRCIVLYGNTFDGNVQSFVGENASVMHQREKLGHWGESVAVRYLRRKGFVLLQRNVHTRFGEIDLIMLDGKELVFVEVKTRRSNRFGTGTEAITKNKLLRIERSIAVYLSTWSILVSYRLDVIGIAKEGDVVFVEHIRNASLDDMMRG